MTFSKGRARYTDVGGLKVQEDMMRITEDVALKKNMEKYHRGKDISLEEVKDKKLKGKLANTIKKSQDAIKNAVHSEILLTEEQGYIEAEGMERTFKFRQDDILSYVDDKSAKKRFDLHLDVFGPYFLDYTRNGRYLLLGGKKGHIAAFDWKSGKLFCELHLKETVRDVQWLHNELFFAVAQKKYVYIYDKTGLEVHQLKKHIDVNRLEFLPYHFLLVSVGNSGYLKYQDVSTGEFICELRTKLGSCNSMTQNPYNAVIHLGHTNGTVTLWSPSMNTPLVKMLCHKGPVISLTIDSTGKYMVSSGLDRQMKIWDLRNYKCLQEYYTILPASNLDISQTGLLGVGYGSHVQIWKDAFLTKQNSPYLSHEMPGHMLSSLYFASFEDVLGIGHDTGFSSILIPGAGEANIDTFEANPFETKRQRQESEVKMLLDKLRPEMIQLDPNFVGNIIPESKEMEKYMKKVEFEANHPEEEYKLKNNTRGKSSSLRRYLRKQANVIDEKREALRRRLIREKLEREKKKNHASRKFVEKSVLDRFTRKSD